MRRLALPVLLLAAAGCGGSPTLSSSTSPDDLVEAWSAIVCGDDPEPIEAGEFLVGGADDAAEVVSCTIRDADIDDDEGPFAQLAVWDESGPARDVGAEPECDVWYSTTWDDQWVSTMDNGTGSDSAPSWEELVDAGAQLGCEGQ